MDHSNENLIKTLVEGQVERLADNVVNYEIYPPNLDASLEELNTLQRLCLHHLEPFLQGYIWQCDRFELNTSLESLPHWEKRAQKKHRNSKSNPSTSTPHQNDDKVYILPRLWGSLRFGENIEDEWFATWLLSELTRALPVTARVWDNDGEFLLIEAAYVLPRWLKPDVATNRVWLHQGALQLVPLPTSANDPNLPAAPSIQQALTVVRSEVIDTTTPAAAAQKALELRLGKYPAYAQEIMHRATFILPAQLAYVVNKQPQVAAAAVEAFYYRDPTDLSAARAMKYFPPKDMVESSVVLNRCLYAQLALQQYTPPKGYPMPFPSEKREFEAAEIGAKLVAGFEALMAQNARSIADSAGSISSGGEQQNHGHVPPQQKAFEKEDQILPSEEALRNDPGWQTHKSHLERIGFFPDALPGSAAYTAALKTAIESYATTETYRVNTNRLRQPALVVSDLLKEPFDVVALLSLELPPPSSDAWLHEEPTEIEAELERRRQEMEQDAKLQNSTKGKQNKQPREGKTTTTTTDEEIEFDPTELALKLRQFLGEDLSSNGDDSGLDRDSVGFDELRFAQELHRVLALGSLADDNDINDNDDESSDEGSSFYSGGDSDDESSEDDADKEGIAAGLKAHDQSSFIYKPPSFFAQQQHNETWETATATDSDDADSDNDGFGSSTKEDGDDDFSAAYSHILEQQLAGTKVTRTFQTPSNQSHDAGVEEGAVAAELQPVDVDVNLVSSLLASYKEQAGMPGPASNLAGLLGINLPDPGAL